MARAGPREIHAALADLERELQSFVTLIELRAQRLGAPADVPFNPGITIWNDGSYQLTYMHQGDGVRYDWAGEGKTLAEALKNDGLTVTRVEHVEKGGQ